MPAGQRALRRARHALGGGVGVLAAAALLGCGSSGPSLTHLRMQATRICRGAAIGAGAITAPRDPAGAAAFLRRGLAVLEPELSQLRKLTPTSDTAEVYHAALGAFAQELTAMRQALRSLARGDDAVIVMQRLQRRLTPLESQQYGAWQALQIPACLPR